MVKNNGKQIRTNREACAAIKSDTKGEPCMHLKVVPGLAWPGLAWPGLSSPIILA